MSTDETVCLSCGHREVMPLSSKGQHWYCPQCRTRGRVLFAEGFAESDESDSLGAEPPSPPRGQSGPPPSRGRNSAVEPASQMGEPITPPRPRRPKPVPYSGPKETIWP